MAVPSQAVPAFARLAGHPLRWRLLIELAHSDLRVRDLTAMIGQPQNLISYHLRLLRDACLVTAGRSSFDGRDSYYHLDLTRCEAALHAAGAALHPALAPDPVADRWAGQVSVLFVCTGNSARSPIAEALLRHRTGGRIDTASAGTRPKERLHPHAVRVLRERYDIDLPAGSPRHLDSLTGRRFDYLITMCDKAREAVPDSGAPLRVHWSIRDPGHADPRTDAPDVTGFRAFVDAADDIDTRIRHLLPVLARTSAKGRTP